MTVGLPRPAEVVEAAVRTPTPRRPVRKTPPPAVVAAPDAVSRTHESLSPYGSASAINSAGTPGAPIATTINCRSFTM